MVAFSSGAFACTVIVAMIVHSFPPHPPFCIRYRYFPDEPGRPRGRLEGVRARAPRPLSSMGEYKPFGGAFGRLGDDESSGTLLGSPVRKPRFDEGDYVSDDVSSPELMRRLAASQMALEGTDS